MAASTTIWKRPASSGESPPNTAPTKAPGRVTSPVVFVWSTVGTSAALTARRTRVSVARRGGAPSASHPSTVSHWSTSNSRKTATTDRRDGHRVADHDPPTASAYRGLSSIAPVPNTTAPVTTMPMAIETPDRERGLAQCAEPSAAVTTATENITTSATAIRTVSG